jgi:hypothetical protein
MSNIELHNLRHNRGLCRWSKNGSIHWSVKCERVWWWRCIPVPLHVGLWAVAMWFGSFFFAYTFFLKSIFQLRLHSILTTHSSTPTLHTPFLPFLFILIRIRWSLCIKCMFGSAVTIIEDRINSTFEKLNKSESILYV